MRKLLTNLNQFDLKLFDFAQSVVALRLKHIKPIMELVNPHRTALRSSELVHTAHQQPYQTHLSELSCRVNEAQARMFLKNYHSVLGVFRPQGHKGP